MGDKHQKLRTLLTNAIIDLCRRETFYIEELRIEGTVCLVSDRSSVVIAQITEQIGENSGHKDFSDADQEPDSLTLASPQEELTRTDNDSDGVREGNNGEPSDKERWGEFKLADLQSNMNNFSSSFFQIFSLIP